MRLNLTYCDSDNNFKCQVNRTLTLEGMCKFIAEITRQYSYFKPQPQLANNEYLIILLSSMYFILFVKLHW